MKKERENNLQFSHKKYIKYVDEGPMHMDNGVGTDCGSRGWTGMRKGKMRQL